MSQWVTRQPSHLINDVMAMKSRKPAMPRTSRFVNVDLHMTVTLSSNFPDTTMMDLQLSSVRKRPRACTPGSFYFILPCSCEWRDKVYASAIDLGLM